MSDPNSKEPAVGQSSQDMSTVTPSSHAEAVEAARLALTRALDAVSKIPTTPSHIPPAPPPATDSVTGDGVPIIPIPMEYEPFRYGNSLNTEAVLSVQNMHRGITFEQGESALELLGHRYNILRSSKKCIEYAELFSKEYYPGRAEEGLVKARGLFDKAKSALYEAHLAMWGVYCNVIMARNAPSVSREEYHRRRDPSLRQPGELDRDWREAGEWKKRQELMWALRGCKWFDRTEPETVEEQVRNLPVFQAAHAVVHTPSEHSLGWLWGTPPGDSRGVVVQEAKER